MKELSLHILDIVQNSLRADAKCIYISILYDLSGDLVEITIKDDGCGMTPEFLSAVTDPFVTTRTTRKIGMGIPLFKMAAKQAGGTFHINSAPGQGTEIQATFIRSHIDTPPLGDMAETIVTLVQGAPDVEFIYSYNKDLQKFNFDTRKIRAILEDIPLNEPEVLSWIKSKFRETEALVVDE